VHPLIDNSYGTEIAVADINHDGIGDIITGGSDFTTNGSAYVIFGGPSLGQRDISTTPLTGSDGFRVDCPYSDSGLCGEAVAGVDMNGDGNADLVVTVPYGNVTGSNAEGYVYVLFGKPSGWTATYSLGTIY
jgi:hypothetical protein